MGESNVINSSSRQAGAGTSIELQLPSTQPAGTAYGHDASQCRSGGKKIQLWSLKGGVASRLRRMALDVLSGSGHRSSSRTKSSASPISVRPSNHHSSLS